MDKVSVSIIVPIYNVEPYVEDCLRSVMRQTYEGPIECILVNDCGTDQSMTVAERVISAYAGPITFKVLYHAHNRGLSAARNTGMDKATGDYIFFLDSDDELTDDCIERLAEPAKGYAYDIIVGNTRNIDLRSHTVSTESFLKIPDQTALTADKILESLQRRDWMIAVWNKLYLTGFIRKHQLCFKEGIIFEDILWTFQIACLATSLFAVNHAIYLYKTREGSIMASADNCLKVHSYHVSVKEMGKFVRSQKLYNTPIHELIQEFLRETIRESTFGQFRIAYKDMRQHIKPSFSELKKADGLKLRNLVRDCHYLMPTVIASFWQYYIIYRFRLFVVRCFSTNP